MSVHVSERKKLSVSTTKAKKQRTRRVGKKNYPNNYRMNCKKVILCGRPCAIHLVNQKLFDFIVLNLIYSRHALTPNTKKNETTRNLMRKPNDWFEKREDKEYRRLNMRVRV